ncbi:type II secretion system F family protein [uncultured Friedmanniella sp.]|uniref:type II secretion system F family protein n=1 Tax=uncultured Friedmanniella sp. TaxID=335381 RepID=UPI0035CB4A22
MIGLSVLLAVLAALLGVTTPAAAGLRRLPSGDPGTPVRSGRQWWRRVAAAVAVAAALTLTVVLAGPRAAVYTATSLLVLATVAHLGRLRGRRRAAERGRLAVAEAATVLAANLRVGMVPAQALTKAAAGCPVLDEARATLAIGGDVPAVWRRQSAVEGRAGLRELARAWQVSGVSGASLTGTLEEVAAGLAADQSLRAVVGSELAAPRATGKLMAVLPVLGIGMGYLIGGDPLQWLVAGPAGWGCLLLGVGLACAGVLWIENLARRAAAQA